VGSLPVFPSTGLKRLEIGLIQMLYYIYRDAIGIPEYKMAIAPGLISKLNLNGNGEPHKTGILCLHILYINGKP
jgi:hypothetical protein